MKEEISVSKNTKENLILQINSLTDRFQSGKKALEDLLSSSDPSLTDLDKMKKEIDYIDEKVQELNNNKLIEKLSSKAKKKWGAFCTEVEDSKNKIAEKITVQEKAQEDERLKKLREEETKEVEEKKDLDKGLLIEKLSSKAKKKWGAFCTEVEDSKNKIAEKITVQEKAQEDERLKKLREEETKEVEEKKDLDKGLLIAGLIVGSTGLGMGIGAGVGIAVVGGIEAAAAMIGVSTALATIAAIAIPAVVVATGVGLLIGHAVQQGQEPNLTI